MLKILRILDGVCELDRISDRTVSYKYFVVHLKLI